MSSSDSDSLVGERVEKKRSSISRRRWLQVAGAGGVAALAGCSGGNSGNNSKSGGNGAKTSGSNGVTTIEYWRWPHSTEPSNTAEKNIIKEFNKGPGKKKGIKIKEVITPFSSFQQKLKTAIGGKSAPAVGWGFSLRLFDPSGKSWKEVKQKMPMEPLEDYISKDYKNEFYSEILRWQLIRFKGLIGLPFISNLSPGFLYVNVDAWKKAGLGDLPSGTWSYEEFHNALSKLHGTKVNGNSISGLGLAFKDAASNGEWPGYAQLAHTYGDILDNGYQNKDGKYVMAVASDASVGAWNDFVQTPVKKGWTNNPMAQTFDGLQEPLAGGDLGLAFQNTFARAQLGKDAKFEWDIVPFPTKDGKDDWVIGGGASTVNMHMFKKDIGGNPKAAWEFLKFRNNAQNQYQWFNTSSQSIANKKSYQMMKDKGVSDFVKKTKGLTLMNRLDKTLKNADKLRQARTDRYPDMKVETRDGLKVLQSDLPTSVGNGRVNDIMGQMMQKLVTQHSKDPKAEWINAEKQWANVMSSSELKLDESSVGYNKPAPKLGPL